MVEKLVNRTVCLPLLLLCLLFPSESFAESMAENIQKSLEASISINWGSLDGFVQTPAGGRLGSSSKERPTLNELNIDESVSYDLLLAYHWRKSTFYAGAQFIRLSESGVLEKDLVSHGVDFPAGNHFDSDIRFDWYRAGVSYSFLGQGRMPEISPKMELAFLDFDYTLNTPDGKAHRDYIKVAPRVGAEVKMPLTGMLNLKLEAATSVPFSNMPMISDVAFELGAHVMRKRSSVDARIFSRVGYQRIDYEDNQDLPNHIRLEMEPFLGVGVNIQF